MKTKLKGIIFDIDGVLAQKSPDRDYRDYDKVHLDKPIQGGFILLNTLLNNDENYGVAFITGRKELCRNQTLDFIFNNMDNKHFIQRQIDLYGDREYDWFIRTLKDSLSRFLYMREDNDHRPAVQLKQEIYDLHIKDKCDIIMAIDDDPEICKMWKENGIFTLEVKR